MQAGPILGQREAGSRSRVSQCQAGVHPVCDWDAHRCLGKGKGGVDHWVAVVKPGHIILEVAGMEPDVAREALRLAAHKLSIRTQVITRRDFTAAEAEGAA